jgi:carbamoyl-phosphate synthase large subunit
VRHGHVYDMGTLDRYMTQAGCLAGASRADRQVPRGRVRVDVDAVADATGAVVIGGIMEHIEEAGIHRRQPCVVLPFICPERHLNTIRDYTRRIACALKVIGLMNARRHEGRWCCSK